MISGWRHPARIVVLAFLAATDAGTVLHQFIGGSAGTIATGNKLTFYWFIKGSKPNTAADRYITCQVPTPGSA